MSQVYFLLPDRDPEIRFWSHTLISIIYQIFFKWNLVFINFEFFIYHFKWFCRNTSKIKVTCVNLRKLSHGFTKFFLLHNASKSVIKIIFNFVIWYAVYQIFNHLIRPFKGLSFLLYHNKRIFRSHLLARFQSGQLTLGLHEKLTPHLAGIPACSRGIPPYGIFTLCRVSILNSIM